VNIEGIPRRKYAKSSLRDVSRLATDENRSAMVMIGTSLPRSATIGCSSFDEFGVLVASCLQVSDLPVRRNQCLEVLVDLTKSSLMSRKPQFKWLDAKKRLTGGHSTWSTFCTNESCTVFHQKINFRHPC
jgi:hypothetical protein